MQTGGDKMISSAWQKACLATARSRKVKLLSTLIALTLTPTSISAQLPDADSSGDTQFAKWRAEWSQYNNCVKGASIDFSTQPDPAEIVARAVIALCRGYRDSAEDALTLYNLMQNHQDARKLAKEFVLEGSKGDLDYALSEIMAERLLAKRPPSGKPSRK